MFHFSEICPSFLEKWFPELILGKVVTLPKINSGNHFSKKTPSMAFTMSVCAFYHVTGCFLLRDRMHKPT